MAVLLRSPTHSYVAIISRISNMGVPRLILATKPRNSMKIFILDRLLEILECTGEKTKKKRRKKKIPKKKNAFFGRPIKKAMLQAYGVAPVALVRDGNFKLQEDWIIAEFFSFFFSLVPVAAARSVANPFSFSLLSYFPLFLFSSFLFPLSSRYCSNSFPTPDPSLTPLQTFPLSRWLVCGPFY